MNRLIVFIFVCILAFIVGGGIAMLFKQEIVPVRNTPTATPTLAPLNAQKIYQLVNNHRKSIGVKGLVFDPSMCPFAEKRAKQLNTNYSHDGYIPVPYTYVIAGENIGGGISEEIIVKTWLDSPDHRGAIEDGRYTNTCLTVSERFAVQHFASF